MANSNTQLNLIATSQASKEVTANALFDAASPAMVLGRNANTTSGLTWGYYGGTVRYNSTLAQIPNGTVNLTANTTNYVEFDQTNGAITVNQSAWTGGTKSRMYKIATGASTVTSYEDWRDFSAIASGGGASIASYKETSGLNGGTLLSSSNSVLIGSGNYLHGGSFNLLAGINNGNNSGSDNSFRYAFGAGNSPGGNYSHAYGYSNNNYNGDYKMTFGYYHEVTASSGISLSFLFGSHGLASRYGSWVFSVPFNPNPNTSGYHSSEIVKPSGQTSGGETSHLYSPWNLSGNFDQGVVVRSNTTVVVSGYVIARANSSNQKTSVWKVEAVVLADGSGNCRFVATPTITVVAQDSALSSCTCNLSVSTNKLDIAIGGSSSMPLYWTSDLNISELYVQ